MYLTLNPQRMCDYWRAMAGLPPVLLDDLPENERAGWELLTGKLVEIRANGIRRWIKRFDKERDRKIAKLLRQVGRLKMDVALARGLNPTPEENWFDGERPA